MKKKLISILCSVAMVLSLAACGNGGNSKSADSKDEASKKDGLTKVSIGMVTWPDFMLFYLADEKGIFEKNGLDVDIQEFASTTDNSSAFIAGNLDFNR